MGINQSQKHNFCQALLSWAKSNLRDYPWRASGVSPYNILVAELLLKRTTATAAARAYTPFLEKYHSAQRLALATEKELSLALKPIGLSRQRAKAIHRLAQVLVQRFEGVPNTFEQLCELPGVGDYAARAILSFGHSMPMAVVDGNVERVIRRAFQDDVGSSGSRKRSRGLSTICCRGSTTVCSTLRCWI